MVNIKAASLWFLLVMSFQVKAQQSIDNFLTDVLSVKDFKLNTSLSDLKKNGNTKDHFFVFEKEDNSILVQLKKSSINLLGLQSIEMVNLIFIDEKLNYIDFDILGNPANGIYEKTFENFKTRYGVPVTSSVVDNPFKKYTWTTSKSKLTLRPNMNRSFSIIFSNNIQSQKPLWIYNSRSGKGRGEIQLKLAYFEKLLNSNLTISAFEKYLPSWKSEGELNHIEYDFNPKTKAQDIPQYRLQYQLGNCGIEIKTADTTSKVITDYSVRNLDDPKIIATFKEDLKNLEYIKDPDIGSFTSSFYANKQKKINVIVDDGTRFRISVFRDH
jgi:hypothetical protein